MPFYSRIANTKKNMFHFVWGWFFSTNVCFCICTYAVIYCNPYILLLNFHVTDQYVSQNMWFIVIPPLSIANPNFIGTVYEPIWKMGWPSPIWSTGTEMVGSVSKTLAHLLQVDICWYVTYRLVSLDCGTSVGWYWYQLLWKWVIQWSLLST